jgi:hypothetical protein
MAKRGHVGRVVTGPLPHAVTETFDFNADIQQLMDLIMRHLLLQEGKSSFRNSVSNASECFGQDPL